MNSYPKVSIIVPVYNVKQYLQNSIESVLVQSFQDFELILVDDGSFDGSADICDMYASKDPRIKVLHKQNGGVSDARNFGLDYASGEWVTFLDADDWLDASTLKICSEFLNAFDYLRFSAAFIYSAAIMVDYQLKSYDSKIDYLKDLFERSTILGVWGGFYKCSIIKENNIRFKRVLHNGEDWLFLFSYLMHCDTIKVINQPLYKYNKINEQSCTNTMTVEKDLDSFKAFQAIIEISEGIDELRPYIVTTTNKILLSSLLDCFHESGFRQVRNKICMVYNYVGPQQIKHIICSKIIFKDKLHLMLFKSILGQYIYFLRVRSITTKING
jgi:glycosyltransferase involved in cell wall biosynthesis